MKNKIAIIGQGYVGLPFNFKNFKNNHVIIFDTKSIIDRSLVDARL